MQVFKTIIGIILALCGIGLVLLGGYIVLQERSWASVGGFTVLLGFGFLIAYLGYDLFRGRSIKDDLFFLFFN